MPSNDDSRTTGRSSFGSRLSSELQKMTFGMQFFIVLVVVLTFLLMWTILKYAGIIVGIILLIFSLIKLIAENALVANSNGQQGNPRRFRALAGGGVALIMVSAIIDYVAYPIRPNSSEIAQADYDAKCSGGGKFDSACKGKFVLWTGVVQTVGSDFVRTKIDDGDVTVDIHDVDPHAIALVEGQKIKVSGWLARENMLYPDVEKGAISPIESKNAAVSRIRQERIASGDAYSPAECAAETNKTHLYSEIKWRCGQIHDGVGWGPSMDRDVCAAKEAEKIRGCGLSVDMAN